MKKTDWKYLVDVVMFLVMIGIILVGLLLAFIIKEGQTNQGIGKYFLGLHRHQWSNIHLLLSLIFTATLVFHLILEWSWIKGKSKMLFQEPLASRLGIDYGSSSAYSLGIMGVDRKKCSGIRRQWNQI